MKPVFKIVMSAVLLAGSSVSQALALGPDEFAASRQLTCVLAQDSLGYLSESQYDEMVGDVLDSYDDVDGDVIYAKALGYFDGLMFGISERDQSQINVRLQSFVESQACTQIVGVNYQL
jgi:hypothetical protein